MTAYDLYLRAWQISLESASGCQTAAHVLGGRILADLVEAQRAQVIGDDLRRAHLADFDAHPDVPAVRDRRIHLVDGKLATWYGPRIAEALRVLPRLIAGE